MLLAIDIGNSTIGLGLFRDPFKGKKPIVGRIPSHPAESPGRYRGLLKGFIERYEPMALHRGSRAPLLDVIVSSVVPSLSGPIIRSVTGLCRSEPLVVAHTLETGLSFSVERPEEIGADRIANAVAAIHLCGKPVAVADLGTASTVTVVGKKRDFLGGAILPGLGLMQRVLHAGTAQLPLIPLARPRTVLGTNTMAAIISGIIYGTAGAVETLVRRMEKERRFRVELVLTGGHARLIASLIRREWLLVPDLTLEGMRLLYLRNSRNIP
ncbi:MAG TPA: type III pantothenate kinase [Dissulfurispiraceae bacterium]|nr:type III pantothenate kinase [Dissulfurispiraceae bacterium]